MAHLPIRPVTRPAVLSGQTNGRLDPSILVTWSPPWGGPAVTLVGPALRCYQAMASVAYADGIELKSVGSYRTYTQQVNLFVSRYRRVAYETGIWWDGSYWVHVSGAVAAVPGTSNHGWGLADDIGEERDGDDGVESISPAAVDWLADHALEYGYSAELESEPWHWRLFTGDAIPAAVIAYERSIMPTVEEIWNAALYRDWVPAADGSRPVRTQAQYLLGARADAYYARAEVTALRAALETVLKAGASPDQAALLAAVDERLAVLRDELDADRRDALGDLAEQGAAGVREATQ